MGMKMKMGMKMRKYTWPMCLPMRKQQLPAYDAHVPIFKVPPCASCLQRISSFVCLHLSQRLIVLHMC